MVILQCVDSQHTGDGKGKVVSPTRWLPHEFSGSDTLFCYRLSKPKGLVWLEVLGKLIEIIHHHMGSRTHDLVACHILPEW
jgi:hypothetical protein